MPLPQLSDATFITDGGMETTLIFHGGLDLPHFASFVLDTPTWRANADWGERLGYTAEALADINRRGVRLLERLREEAGPGGRSSSAAASARAATATRWARP